MIKILRLQAAELKKHNIVQKVLVNLAAQNETKILLLDNAVLTELTVLDNNGVCCMG